MKINPLISATLLLATLVISFGCADVIVDPATDVNDPNFIDVNKAKAYKTFTRTIDVTTQSLVRLEGINGTVNIQTVSGTNQVSVSGEKIVKSNSYQDANSHLDDIAIDIDELTNEIVIKTVQPQFSNGRTYEVNYTITLPSSFSLEIRNVNGNIDGNVSIAINGTADLKTQNGSIKLDIPQNTSADFSANLVNGNISTHNLTFQNRVVTSKSLQGTLGDGQGIISLKTTNGNIDVAGLQ